MPAKVYKVSMSGEDRSYLQSLVSTDKVVACKRVRAQILLKSNQIPGQKSFGDQ